VNSLTQDILSFWFGAWPYDEKAAKQQASLWFESDEALDKKIEETFGDAVQAALVGEFPCDSQEDKIASILLLDQFTRNIFRGQAKAFSGDPQALDICLAMIDSQHHLTQPLDVAIFCCMPLQHSEDLAIQERSIKVFSQLVERHGEKAQRILEFAQTHKAIIEEFSRYPHRNKALGRTSTEQERQYLENSGMRFGQ